MENISHSIEFLARTYPWALSLGIFIIAGISALKIYLQYKREVLGKMNQEHAFREAQVPGSLDNLEDLLIQNFKTLNSFYSENLSQYRTSSLASISIAILGFVVIISGVMIAIIGHQVTIGAVSSAAGIVSEGAAMLFFKQNQTFQTQMEGSLKKLVSSQYLMTAIALAREMGGPQKDTEIQQINQHLRHTRCPT
jgi:hypothetical protein